ncbi:TonB-dependent copper receptor [Paludibacterium paludis]|uniref:TonB-dependent copper receptor n=1 Tax=Paludibacterium paludis TaxID=1225769 RepID=A0A918UAA5_9NEIS|nr:TonB-dependent copper receptor [Paludibacterium paludis]GGY16245.1 TonB-dependent copper receptor [Paludibacterium paludis]
MRDLLRFIPLPAVLAVTQAFAADLRPVYIGDEVVVTAVRSRQPLRVETDPRAPRQPVPAADGAGLLKSIPGFSVARKGGESGDPVLRGLGGSRLAIQADGAFLYGGCGGRMDPPTAYLFPDAWDKVTVVKGPQSVTMGAPLIAGAVDFERRTAPFDEAGARLSGGLMAGSGDRNEVYADAAFGARYGYLRVLGTRNHGGDYRDGAGRKVHSSYRRESQTLIAGFTPDSATLIELTVDKSRGQAAYADRGMDGSRFDREAWSLKAERRNLADWLTAVRLNIGHSNVDHVMDNYTLRPWTPAAKRAAMNPVREVDTGKAAAELQLGDLSLTVGVDTLRDRHEWIRNRVSQSDQASDNTGVFAEGRLPLGDSGTLVSGLRRDLTRTTYDSTPQSAAGRVRDYELESGFARYEHRSGAWTGYAGFGQAMRAPDYWEDGIAARQHPEKLRQLDIGALYQAKDVKASLSAFAGRIDNYILRQTGVGYRNVNAWHHGLEADISWEFLPSWTATGTLAWVHADNLSDRRPLAQTTPLQGTLGVGYDNGAWSAGALWRLAARQDRIASGQGGIVGLDNGETAGFGILSLNAGWQIDRHNKLTAGVDNVFNRVYAEAVSKGGVPIPGYESTGKVNEPGRTLWVKWQGTW